MATSILTDTIKDPGGNVVATSPGTTVNFRLMANGSPTPGFRISDGVNVASLIVTSASTTGTISQALENNSNIVPTGTYYVAEILCPSSQGGTQEWALLSSSSASPQDFHDALAAVIPAFTPITTVPTSILGGNNAFTGTNQFNGNVYFKSGQPWVDVKAFGAVGNGVTDDGPAITLAIAGAAAAGAMLYISPGTYRIATADTNGNGLTLATTGLTVFGAGPALSKIVGDTTLTYGIQAKAAFVTVEGIGYTTSSNVTSYAFGVAAPVSAETVTFRRCAQTNPSGGSVGVGFAVGIDGVGDISEILLEDCRSDFASNGAFEFGLGASNAGLNITMLRCVGDNSHYGIYSDGANWAAYGCTLEDNVIDVSPTTPNGGGWTVDGMRSENSQQFLVSVGGANNGCCSIRNVNWHNNSMISTGKWIDYQTGGTLYLEQVANIGGSTVTAAPHFTGGLVYSVGFAQKTVTPGWSLGGGSNQCHFGYVQIGAGNSVTAVTGISTDTTLHFPP